MSTTPAGRFPGPGERIGPYEVVRRLGVGGMGVVVEAVDTVLQRRVALKVIAPHLAGDPAFRLRFTREAQAQASLDSPHVVPVFAHGEVDRVLYLASPLLPDGDLGALIERSGPLPPRAALEVIAQVAEGLADAHAQGLIHRDIKPANVLLRVRGEKMSAYLADFGIACRNGTTEPPATEGFAVGTPDYLAPELHAGSPPGAATDLYALGCLLWAALTGRAPYSGTSEDGLASAHRSAPIPQLVGTGPFEHEVNRILRRALAKHPHERYPSARALRDDLRRVLRDHRAPSVARRTPAAVAVVVALVVVGLVVLVGAPVVRGPDDEQTAAVNIASALGEEAGFGRAEADCTARALVELSGVDGLQEQGVLDDDLELVVDPDAGVDSGVIADLIAVSVPCVFETVGIPTSN